MEKLYTAVATSTGGRSGRVKSSDGIIDMDVRPPREMGGPTRGYTNPEQLFAAGYAACFGSALGHVAGLKKMRIDPQVTAKVSIGKNDSGGFALAVELEVKIPGISQTEAQALTEEAHQVCPYSNATRNNVEVTLNVSV